MRQGEGEDQRHQLQNLLLRRIHAGRRRHALHQPHGEAIEQGPDPHVQRPFEEASDDRRQGWIPRDQAEQVPQGAGIACGKVLHPAEEGRVPHLDRDVEHLEQRQEDGDRQQARQAAQEGIDPLTLVQRHHLLLLLGRVVLVFDLQLLELRLHLLHLGERLVALVRRPEEHQPHAHRQQQDGDAEIAGVAIEELERGEDRPRQEP